jgi:predicted nucleotidyltransferase
MPIAKNYGIKKMYIFGSYARGDYNENSDLDIAFEYDSSEIRSYAEEFSLLCDLEDALDIKVDLLSIESINYSKHPITKRLRTNFYNERIDIFETNRA